MVKEVGILNSVEEMVDALEKLVSHGGSKSGRVIDKLTRSSKGEIFILKYLYEKDTTVLPSELSEAMGSSTARISAALKSLESKGLVCREIDPSDRRNILVSITQAGHDRIVEMIHRKHRYLSAILTEMGLENARQFVCLATLFTEIAHSMLDNEHMWME